MVIKTLAVLLSLLVILLSPRAPHSSLVLHTPTGSSGLDQEQGPAAASSASSAAAKGVLFGAGPLYLTPRQLRKNVRLRAARGDATPAAAAAAAADGEKGGCGGGRNGDDDEPAVCCSQPIPKMLSIGKFIPLETSKRYLVRHVWLMRCPGTFGCCSSLREHCAPTQTEPISLEIPVEISTGRNQFVYVNETHKFVNHVQCACKWRTHQALANYISRELISYYDGPDALDMVHRICKAVQRRIRKLNRYDPRFRHNSKRKRRPRRDIEC